MVSGSYRCNQFKVNLMYIAIILFLNSPEWLGNNNMIEFINTIQKITNFRHFGRLPKCLKFVILASVYELNHVIILL